MSSKKCGTCIHHEENVCNKTGLSLRFETTLSGKCGPTKKNHVTKEDEPDKTEGLPTIEIEVGEKKPQFRMLNTAETTGRKEEQALSGIEITESAQELIDEHGLDRSEIEGSGADGKIIKNDVFAYLKTLEMPVLTSMGEGLSDGDVKVEKEAPKKREKKRSK